MDDVIKTPNSLSAKNAAPLALNDLVIKTSRLKLSPITTEYAETIFKEFTPEVVRYMIPASPKEISETIAFIDTSIEQRNNNTDLVLVILDKASGEFFGVCGLHGRDNPREPELGIWLKVGAHGLGYGREAIQAVYHWASGTLNVDAFIYPVDKANTPSRKIPESLGGIVTREVEGVTQRGGTLDEVVYRISCPVGQGSDLGQI